MEVEGAIAMKEIKTTKVKDILVAVTIIVVATNG